LHYQQSLFECIAYSKTNDALSVSSVVTRPRNNKG